MEDHAQLSFSSQLTLEEIERNFADVDLYEGLIAALSEALELRKGVSDDNSNAQR